MFRTFSSIALLSSVVFLTGCGGSGPAGTVTGKVTKNGQPVAAQVSFRGETGTASGISDATTGVYTLSTGESNSVPIGKYQIAVSPVASSGEVGEADYAKMMEGGGGASAPSSSAIPAKYNNFGSSGLECTITEGANTVDINLE